MSRSLEQPVAPPLAAPRVSPYLVVAAGIAVSSMAAIFIKYALAEGIPPLAIAALRLAIASVILVPLSLSQSLVEWKRLTRDEWFWAGVSGLALAVHFGAWVTSLRYTSIMSSVVLVATNPLFVAVVSALVLRERVTRITFVSIALATLGGLVIAGSDLSANGESLWGNFLAVVGALGVAVYILIGRRLRRTLSLRPYVTLVYGLAAFILVLVALGTSTPLAGFSSSGWTWTLLLALGPQLTGHSALNWSLKYLRATFVSIALLAEPIGTTLLAIFLFGEIPTPIKLAGGVLILAAIVFAALRES